MEKSFSIPIHALPADIEKQWRLAPILNGKPLNFPDVQLLQCDILINSGAKSTRQV